MKIFRVGDRVKCINNEYVDPALILGGTYTVKGQDGTNLYLEKPNLFPFYADRFELIATSSVTPATTFKCVDCGDQYDEGSPLFSCSYWKHMSLCNIDNSVKTQFSCNCDIVQIMKEGCRCGGV